MIEGLEQSDVYKLQAQIANYINDLAIKAAEKKGQNVQYEYGKIHGLIAAADMINKAQEGYL